MRSDFDPSQIVEQEVDDILTAEAWQLVGDRRAEVIDTLTYNNYRWQRSYYGLAAERLAKVFPRADKYEAMYQEELQRRAA
jgi:hypothetical protein